MSIATAIRPDPARLSRAADWLAVAIAVSLPWSTSATGILAVIWLLVVIPTLDLAGIRRELMTLAGGLPVLLVVLGLVGMLWADVPWAAARRGFEPFLKLLFIPLLLIHFRRSERAMWVLAGFLASCTALLFLSFIHAIWPHLPGFAARSPGIPVKDRIIQSGEFVLCAFLSAYLALDFLQSKRRLAGVVLFILSAAFLLSLMYVSTSRTALVTIPFLLVLLALPRLGWKGTVGVLVAGAVLGAVVWASSPPLRKRVIGLMQEVEAYQTDRQATSAGERLEFWKKSLGFIAEAPVIGHGTGSIRSMFERTLTGETGRWALGVANPHNQTLSVAIQLGLVGVAVLWAMWLSHFVLFWRPSATAWIGLAVVLQNVVGSVFNSHLFDFTQGWIYVFGVGVAGGALLRDRPLEPQRTIVDPVRPNSELPRITSGSGEQRSV